MSESGLQAVSNPSELFLSEQYLDSEVLAGLAVAVIMDGSRTFLIEIQVTLLDTFTAFKVFLCRISLSVCCIDLTLFTLNLSMIHVSQYHH